MWATRTRGAWHRQVSLLAAENIEFVRIALPHIGPGDFAENVVVSGLDLKRIPRGYVIQLVVPPEYSVCLILQTLTPLVCNALHGYG